MSASVELDIEPLELRALSLAPGMQVAVGDLPGIAALNINGPQALVSVAADAAPLESVGVTDAGTTVGDTLTCGPEAELRLHWSELQAWFEQS